MAKLNQFSTPAMQVDFPDDPEKQAQLNALWSTNVDAFTQQAIVGNPWTSTNAENQTYYFNMLDTDVPEGTASALISWFPFPNRLSQYLGSGASPENYYNLTQDELNEVADTGDLSNYPIPTTLCPEPVWPPPPPPAGTMHPYGPYGPRGWQDEYCEWSVVRNSDDKITRVDFTCENPEYWYTLWRIDPQRVADLYESTLNAGAPADQQVQVSVTDLQLVDPTTGEPVIDPSTGRPAYNPLNRWNNGPVSTRGGSNPSGGAMHLTSTPNTLQTELGLAGAATVQRTVGNTQAQPLICCAVYGQPFRHSDPHIGQSVNQAVVQGPNPYQVSLENPPGLYIQQPANFGLFHLPPDPNLPSGATASQCWQVVRGVNPSEQPVDPLTGQPYPGNLILHAVFQLPLEWINAGVSFTVGDITIGTTASNAVPIQWGSQIVQTFLMGLYGLPIPASTMPPVLQCVGTPDGQGLAPTQMMYANLWEAYYNTPVANPVGFAMNLASNTVIVPAVVEQGAQNVMMALTFSSLNPLAPGDLPQVVFPPFGDIAATSLTVAPVTYAPPGNSYPSGNYVLMLNLDVAADAALGLRGLQLGPGSPETGPAFLNVVPAGTLGSS